MKNKTILLMTLSIVAILGLGLVAAFLGNGKMHSGLYEIDEEMKQFKVAIQEAIENEDFESWRTLMESQLTQEKFDGLVEKHNQFSEEIPSKEEMMQAWENKDYETMAQLKEQMYGEEGMNQFRGSMHGDYTGEFQGHEGYFQYGEDSYKKEGFFHMLKFWKR